MKKGKKEKGVGVACIPERAVANVAVARFLERATATSDLTTGFILPRGHFPQIQLSTLAAAVARRLPRALRTPSTLPRPQIQRRPRPRPQRRPGAPTTTSTPPAPPSSQAPEVSTPAPPSPLPLPRVSLYFSCIKLVRVHVRVEINRMRMRLK